MRALDQLLQTWEASECEPRHWALESQQLHLLWLATLLLPGHQNTPGAFPPLPLTPPPPITTSDPVPLAEQSGLPPPLRRSHSLSSLLTPPPHSPPRPCQPILCLKLNTLQMQFEFLSIQSEVRVGDSCLPPSGVWLPPSFSRFDFNLPLGHCRCL